MIKLLESTLSKIPLSQILEDAAFDYRLPDPEQNEILLKELERLAQLHPIFLEEAAPGQFLILDGHRRFEAFLKLHSKSREWDAILAHVVPKTELTPQIRFQILRDRNFYGDFSYGLYEKSLFVKDFIRRGLSLIDIGKELRLPVHTIMDIIECAESPAPLARHLNKSPIAPLYAVMLLRKYRGWKKSSHSSMAEAVSARLLEHAKKESLTMKSWKFYLEFYWGIDRPFMAPPREWV